MSLQHPCRSPTRQLRAKAPSRVSHRPYLSCGSLAEVGAKRSPEDAFLFLRMMQRLMLAAPLTWGEPRWRWLALETKIGMQFSRHAAPVPRRTPNANEPFAAIPHKRLYESDSWLRCPLPTHR